MPYKYGSLKDTFKNILLKTRSLTMIRTAIILYNAPCKAVLLLHVPCRPVILLHVTNRLASLHASLSSKAPLSKAGNMVTFTLVNEAVANQGVAITEDLFNQLLAIRPSSFPLPIPDTIYLSFIALVGKPYGRNPPAGVYIFTHIETGQRYVGSSDALSRRFQQYWHTSENKKEHGLLLPLAREEG